MRRLIVGLIALLSLTLHAQQPITVTSPDGQPVAVTFPNPSAPVTCTPASGASFPVGTTPVTCTAPSVSFSVTVNSQRFDPTRDITFKCAFRLPAGTAYQYASGVIAFRPGLDRGSLFFVTKSNEQPQKVVEIKIPECANLPSNTPVSSLPRATQLQGPTDPTEGAYVIVRTENNSAAMIGGMLAVDNKLCGSIFGYYGNGKQAHSHWCRPLDLSVTGQVQGLVELVAQPPIADGTYTVDSTTKLSVPRTFQTGRFVPGYLFDIPAALQSALGGSVGIGSDPANLSGSASNGPDFFGWEPRQIAEKQTVVSNLYYTQQKYLGLWNGQGVLWNGTSETAGMFIAGRDLLSLYRIGVGPYCYGNGVDNQAAVPPDCYDPVNKAHGGHAYPYENYWMAFDLDDFAKVRAGILKPYDVRPRAFGKIEWPYQNPSHINPGLALDRVNGVMYLTHPGVDNTAPIVTVWTVKGL